MSRWKEQINLKTILNQYENLDDDDPCPAPLLQELAAEVEKSDSLKEFSQEIGQCENISDLDEVLDKIYVGLVECGVWCGII